MDTKDLDQTRKLEEERLSSAGILELAVLENAVFDAEKASEARPEDRALAIRLDTAEERLARFFDEHDNAGAFQWTKFGNRMQELFGSDGSGEPDVRIGEDGELMAAKSQAEHRFLLVNMGELDRFNKEGGHDAGDKALGETAIAIEKALGETFGDRPGDADYLITRYDGNTFLVDLPSISLKDFSGLVEKMRKVQPKAQGVEEAAPLTIRGHDLTSVLNVANAIQTELPKDRKALTPEDGNRLMIDVLRRGADWDMEVSKFMKRVERVSEKLIAAASPDLSAEEAAKMRKDAEVFFNEFSKKAFQDTPLETFEGFRQAFGSGRLHEMAESLAVQTAERRLADGRHADDDIQRMIDERVGKRSLATVVQMESSPETVEAEGSAGAEQPRAKSGLEILAEKRKDAETAEKRAAEAAGPEGEELAALAENKREKFLRETARRDAGTGLLKRGVYYKDMENELKSGREVSVVFVDMGFLKYFDQMGGSDVGDAALKSAARLMERALQNAGVKGEVYRYGGDEFTIRVEGDEDAAALVAAALYDLMKEAPPIAPGPKSRPEYAPTKLEFNYSTADRKLLAKMTETAVKDGKYSEEQLDDPDRGPNIKAEMMTKSADVGIEYNKAFSRFKLIYKMLKEPAYETDPERNKQVESVMTFSSKALLGGELLLREWAKASIPDEELDLKILDYVVTKVAEKRAGEKGQKQLLDLLLAAETTIVFLEERVKTINAENEENAGRVKNLQTALTTAREEKEQIVRARGAIDRAA